ncbi:MAG: hypothetical protein LBQ74_01720, partial [Prevotella sp.]|nr:hypothetical protein [Prevotella sp.]
DNESNILNVMYIDLANMLQVGNAALPIRVRSVGRPKVRLTGESADRQIAFTDDTAELEESKLDKVSSTATLDRAYVVTSDGQQTGYPIDQADATPDTLARRTDFGGLKTADPVLELDAANKRYVDTAVGTRQEAFTAGTGLEFVGNLLNYTGDVNFNAFLFHDRDTDNWNILSPGDHTATAPVPLFAYQFDSGYTVLNKAPGTLEDDDYTYYLLGEMNNGIGFCLSSDDVAVGDKVTFSTGVAWVRAKNDAYTREEVNALLAEKEDISKKGVAGGYASLDGNGKVSSGQLKTGYTDNATPGAATPSYTGTNSGSTAPTFTGTPHSHGLDSGILTGTTASIPLNHGDGQPTAVFITATKSAYAGNTPGFGVIISGGWSAGNPANWSGSLSYIHLGGTNHISSVEANKSSSGLFANVTFNESCKYSYGRLAGGANTNSTTAGGTVDGHTHTYDKATSVPGVSHNHGGVVKE